MTGGSMGLVLGEGRWRWWAATAATAATAGAASSAAASSARPCSSIHTPVTWAASRWVATTQPRVRVVRPKEIPKVVGLRHDNAPDADPPASAQIAAWVRPMRISPAPTR
jgi:hypothetical protein